MGKILARFLTSLISALALSAIFMITMYSLITQQFPPDFSHLQKSYAHFRDYQKLVLLQRKDTPKNSEILKSDEEEIEKLTRLYDKRAAMANELLGSSSGKELDSESSESKDQLKKEIVRLNARVLTLEDRLDTLEKKHSK